MKKYEEMDNVEKKNIENHISMTQMFLSIISEKEFNEETLSLMKNNFEMMRISLEDLGVNFDDKAKIRELNERIRRIEDDKSSLELSYGKVASYVKTIRNDVSEALEKEGVSASCNVAFAPDIVIDIQFFSVSLDRFSSFARTEEDEKKADEKQKALYNKCLENFITEKNPKELLVVYSEQNIEKVRNILESVIGAKCDYTEIETSTRYVKDENNKIIYQTPVLRSGKFTFLALESSKNLSQAFKEYR